jgi:hypothetical protein
MLIGASAHAARIDIVGPPGTLEFGTRILVLPNGNFAVSDPKYLSGVGAVFLYKPNGQLLSTLTGSTKGDEIASAGLVAVGSTHFVAISPKWRNGLAGDAGAVTWINGLTGLSGTVGAGNSLVGTQAGDEVGIVETLQNGNYVVCSPGWDLGNASDSGAATFGSGESGVRGAVSAANSLVGAGPNERIGSECIEALSNGHYVVVSPLARSPINFANQVGAVTWGNGLTGTHGFVYPGIAPAGASVVLVSSLAGTHEGDRIGNGGVTALVNGNYVVASPDWDNGTTLNAGAATFGNGNGGIAGDVSVANSLVGTQDGDQVGGGVTALRNGNYVVNNFTWNNGSVENAGAVTWGSGAGGIAGPVTVLNSLVGAQSGTAIGSNGVIALSNGNYVVASPFWRANVLFVNLGAATFGNGSTGITGNITSDNSLIGSNSSDMVGSAVTALTNGNYVVTSPFWRNGVAINAGAATLGDGTNGTTGFVSSGNSLVGAQTADSVGLNVVALSNGNYIVHSPYWDNGATTDVGAITWGSGVFSTTGPVTVFNSLRGLFIESLLSCSIVPWYVDHFSYSCRNLNGDVAGGVGARDGTVVTQGLAFANALTGAVGDRIGDGGIEMLSASRCAVRSPFWSNGKGAITLGKLPVLATEAVDANNSVLGLIPGAGASMVYDFNPQRDELIVGQPKANRVTIFDLYRIFRDDFE